MDLKDKQSTLSEVLIGPLLFDKSEKKNKILPQEMPQNFQTLPEYFGIHPVKLIGLHEKYHSLS